MSNEKKTDLQNWTEATATKICKCKSKKELKSIWFSARYELGQIKSGIDGKSNTIAIATQRKAVANIRKAIKSLPNTQRCNKLKYWALEQTNSDKEIKNGIVTIEHNKAKEHGKAKLASWDKQRTESKQLSRNQFSQIELKCEQWLDSFDSIERAIAIMFFSGRRTVEVFKTAKFKAVRGEKTAVMFDGQAKKKDSGHVYKIEIENRAKVLKSLKGFRDLFANFSTMDNERINKEVSRKLAEKMYKLFKLIGWSQFTKQMNRGTNSSGKRVEIVADVHPHDLRKIYVAYHVDKNMKSATEGQKQAYAQNLLGHDKFDIRASSHYGNWQIV